MRTACVTQSYSSRRPNPPPSRWLCTTTLSSGRPVTRAAVPCARVRVCEPVHTSQRSFCTWTVQFIGSRSEEHTSELQSQSNLVCRLLLEKKKKKTGRGTVECDSQAAVSDYCGYDR